MPTFSSEHLRITEPASSRATLAISVAGFRTSSCRNQPRFPGRRRADSPAGGVLFAPVSNLDLTPSDRPRPTKAGFGRKIRGRKLPARGGATGDQGFSHPGSQNLPAPNPEESHSPLWQSYTLCRHPVRCGHAADFRVRRQNAPKARKPPRLARRRRVLLLARINSRLGSRRGQPAGCCNIRG